MPPSHSSECAETANEFSSKKNNISCSIHRVRTSASPLQGAKKPSEIPTSHCIQKSFPSTTQELLNRKNLYSKKNLYKSTERNNPFKMQAKDKTKHSKKK